MKTRFYAPFDEDSVQRIHRMCHPGYPARPAIWWPCHPTLVLEDGGEVIGSTSFSVSLPPVSLTAWGIEIGYGMGVEVIPSRRGEGWGWLLAQARHQALRDVGIGFFIGMTQPGNTPMLRIFEEQHLKPIERIARAYPDGQDGVVYAGEID